VETEEVASSEVAVAAPPKKEILYTSDQEVSDWTNHVDEVTSQINNILNGTITDFDKFDQDLALKERAKQIRVEEANERRERIIKYGCEGKGEGKQYKWWCKRCFVEYSIDLPENKCTRCKQSDKMMTQEERREELMGKLAVFKEEKVKHQFRKDKWNRWKKSQALLKKSRYINYKAWEYWEPDTDSEEEGDPIVPKDNPEFRAMEADIKQRHKKTFERNATAQKCRERGNQCMKDGDYVGAIEHYDEGLEYRRDCKAIWTNKALAEIKVFRWHDAVESCNKVIEYSEIFEDGYKKSADACFKAFTRRAVALRALHKWEEALEDLNDALQIFPKDREARDLFAKTKAAVEEDRKARALQCEAEAHPATSSPCQEEAPADMKNETESKLPAEPAQAPATGPVRVEIEESDDDDEEAGPVTTANTESLARLSKQDFGKLLTRLKNNHSERLLFCTRRGNDNSVIKKPESEGRKLKIKVEEVPEASGLDNLFKDAERCCVLWKKSQGHVVPLRAEIEKLADPHEAAEKQEAASFLQVTVPRVLQILHALASQSDLHCELSSPCVRHIWPLLSSNVWRHSVLELLMEWSQRTVSAKAMAEFASRHPKPNLQLLIEAATEEKKENMLPPNFEACAQEASKRLERGEDNLDSALDALLQGLSALSATELAVSTMGNLCIAGQSLPAFREQVSPFCDEIISALCRQLEPQNWRLCGRAAGAICNVLRLGDVFVSAVQERCLKPLVSALREECSGDGRSQLLHALELDKAGRGIPYVKATTKLLGALINFIVVRPSGIQKVLELDVLQLVVPLIDPAALATGSTADDEDSAATISTRALLITSRLLSAAPNFGPESVEVDLLKRLDRILEHECRMANKAEQENTSEILDLSLRVLTVLITKRTGALDRLAAKAPRVMELPEGMESPPLLAEPAVPFGKLVSRLLKLTRVIKPPEYISPDGDKSVSSRCRGNLALLFASLIEVQAQDDAPSVIRDMDFSILVDIFVEILRKERGPVQHNAGVCVTRLAQNPRYRQRVRDLNGMESLHQIQLPKVEAQKAEASRLHRLRSERGLI